MRCLFLSFTFPESGTTLRAKAFARIFKKAGHTVTLIAPNPRRYYRSDLYIEPHGTEIHTPSYTPFGLIDPQEGWGPLDWLHRFYHVAFAESYDLIYCFDHKPSCVWPAQLYQKIYNTPVLYDWCDWWGGPDGQFRGFVEKSPVFQQRNALQRLVQRGLFRIEDRMERRAAQAFDAVTVISSALRDRCRELDIPATQVEKLYTPCDPKTVSARTKKEARSELGNSLKITSEFYKGCVVGMAANIVHDHASFWQMIRDVTTERDDINFLLIGPGFDNLPDWMEEKKARERVHLTGKIPFDDMLAGLAASDVLMSPLEPTDYNRGRFPHKFFDYLAAGRPILVSDVGDMPRLVEQYDLGVVNRSGSFAATVIEAADASGRWDEWGANSQQLARTAFSDDEIHRRLNLLLARSMGDRTTANGDRIII
jgi:glycosyltransferase involved in cell wall biosynthesis